MSEFDTELLKLLATHLNNAQYTSPESRVWVLEKLSTHTNARTDLSADEIAEVNATISKLQTTLPTGRH
jgi:precorrin-6B methylase 1